MPLLPLLALGQGQSVAVVYNSKLAPSKIIAEHYAKQRSVPPNNLIGLPLSDGHTIRRAEFTSTLEQPLAKALAKAQVARWPKGFHTIFGSLLGSSFPREQRCLTEGSGWHPSPTES